MAVESWLFSVTFQVDGGSEKVNPAAWWKSNKCQFPTNGLLERQIKEHRIFFGKHFNFDAVMLTTNLQP